MLRADWFGAERLRHRLTQSGICIGIAGWLVVCLAGCGQEREGPTGGQGVAGPARRTASEVARSSADGRVKMESAQRDGRKLLLEISLTSATQLPNSPARFYLTAPQNMAAPVIDGLFVPARNEWLPTSATLRQELGQSLEWKYQGLMRRNPIYSLVIRQEFWRQCADRLKTGNGPVRVRMSMDGWPGPATTRGAGIRRGAERAVELLVANPGQMDEAELTSAPQSREQTGLLRDPRKLVPEGGKWARLAVSADGLYVITPEQLNGAGLGGGAMDAIRIVSGGEIVPTLKLPGGVGFYGFGSQREESADQTYWITSAAGAAVANFAAAPGTSESLAPLGGLQRVALVDEDRELKVLLGNFLSIRGIEWVDREILTTGPLQIGIALTEPLRNARVTSYTVELDLFIEGDPANSRGTKLELAHGNQIFAEIKLQEGQTATMRGSVPASLFNATGGTTLTLRVSEATPATKLEGDEDGVWFDRLRLSYPGRLALVDGHLRLDKDSVSTPGVYRVSLPAEAGRDTLVALATEPVRRRTARLKLEPEGDASRLAAPVRDGWRTEIFEANAAKTTTVTSQTFQDALLDPADPKGIDYLIITHADFAAELTPLLELNAKRGLTTQVVDVQAIYDLFGDGALSTDAIRNYLQYTLRAWGRRAPGFVLLVGDASSDFLEKTRSGVRNFVPTHSYTFGNDMWGSDHWFACALGDDQLADFALGRMPFAHVEDLRSALSKTVEYATPKWGTWRGTFAYVADNLEGFRGAAEQTRKSATPAAYAAERIYLDELPLEDNWYIPKNHIERVWAMERSWMKVSGAGTAGIRRIFDEGVAQLDFFGHGSPNIWTDERIWFGGDSPNRDSQALHGTGHYPFVVNFTCNSGAIDYPMPPWNICISEDLLRVAKAGAVGLLVPSGPGTTLAHQQVASAWRGVLTRDEERNLGVASMLARARYGLEGGGSDMVYMYMLLADPALELQLASAGPDIKFDPAAPERGARTTRIRLDHIEPAEGSAVVWQTDAAGKKVWGGEPVEYKQGALSVDLPLEQATLAGPRQVHAYGWNEALKRDWISSAELIFNAPEIRIANAGLARERDEVGLALEFKNSGRLGGEVHVVLKSAEGRELGQWRAMVSAGETKVLREKIKLESAQLTGRILVVEAALGEQGALDQPVTYRGRLGIPGERDQVRIDLGQSHRRWMGNAVGASVQVEDNTASTAPLMIRWQAGNDSLSTAPLTMTGTPGKRLGAATILRTHNSSATQELILLREGAELDRVPLDALEAREPRPRIVANSIRHTPERPVDGETIYLDFEVENTGSATTTMLTPALYGTDPSVGATQPLPVQTEDSKIDIPPLGPGRRTEVRMRWDPIRNAGVQTVWIDLRGQPDIADLQRREQIASYRLFVKTKSDLARGRVHTSAGLPEDGANAVRIHCIILNSGETDAKDVLVTFFSEKKRTPETRLGMVALPLVAGKGQAEAVLVWKYDPAVWPEARRKNVNIHTEIRLKGSSQRIND